MSQLHQQVGPGVKGFRDNDWVIPLKSHLGTWQTLAVLKASELVAIITDCLPTEYAALSQQLCLAYRLLEDFGQLKVVLYLFCLITRQAAHDVFDRLSDYAW